MLNKILDYSIISKDSILLEEKEGYIFTKVKRSNHKIKLPKEVNKDVAYLFGVIMGDGRLEKSIRKVSKYPRTKLYIYNDSKQYLIRLNEYLKKEFNVPTRIYKKNYNNCYVLEINNKFVWLYFSKYLNIENKKLNLQIPKEVQNRELFKHFLAGLFDTDGYFSKVYGIMLNGSNYTFLLEINKLCEKYYKIKMLGPYKNILKKDGKEYSRCSISTSMPYNEQFKEIVPLKI
ncbi:MAG: LAGLIDADG family homing endonuclease [Candidatus Nanoarchaeia archaeon]|nr:LAGLIDADG family homing endonuclease [Candidatus Nanoarchaeia archaeon]MDD5588054.1 LAGLIDADG family homing endonuclease [Candidatus Nanoarchaeia archaeon]